MKRACHRRVSIVSYTHLSRLTRICIFTATPASYVSAPIGLSLCQRRAAIRDKRHIRSSHKDRRSRLPPRRYAYCASAINIYYKTSCPYTRRRILPEPHILGHRRSDTAARIVACMAIAIRRGRNNYSRRLSRRSADSTCFVKGAKP